ncbi:hypothetical protein M8818_005267 [Zalaria obscura]|uniref:Uncharacterized protein n=1 Tax=Zalaria obscura TaxID=2024903 RepID=A0ACC3SA81_9PEZI
MVYSKCLSADHLTRSSVFDRGMMCGMGDSCAIGESLRTGERMGGIGRVGGSEIRKTLLSPKAPGGPQEELGERMRVVNWSASDLMMLQGYGAAPGSRCATPWVMSSPDFAPPAATTHTAFVLERRMAVGMEWAETTIGGTRQRGQRIKGQRSLKDPRVEWPRTASL